MMIYSLGTSCNPQGFFPKRGLDLQEEEDTRSKALFGVLKYFANPTNDLGGALI